MGDSNGTWGELARHDDDLAEVWDSFAKLPADGESPALDAFVARKHISIASLVRIGARMADTTILAFGGPGYLKFRNIVDNGRWTYAGSQWHSLKLVPHAREPSAAVIVVEGETDGARLTDAYACDVAILPAGAEYFPTGYADQLRDYEMVLVGLDDDAAGNRGAQRILDALPRAVRFAPPANDWCDTEDFPPLPDPADVVREVRVLVPAGELLALEPPDIVSWFEHALLPVGGQLVVHGWAKSFKSFLGLDMLAALAQGEEWCGFEPTEEPCRVAVMQYEIPWPYYQERVRFLSNHARNSQAFSDNFLTYTPTQRPGFRAGNKASEDEVLRQLESAAVQVFLLDPIRRATGAVDLNSEKDVRPILNFFERVQDLGITVVTCHHDNKTYARQGGGDPLGMTGAGAFAGDADSIISVAVPKGQSLETPSRNLHFTLRNAPSIPPRGMRMGEDSKMTYSTTAYGPDVEHDADEALEPAI